MKQIKIHGVLRHEDDCKRIQRVFANNGYKISLLEAQTLWEMHSETYAAGWLGLPKDDTTLFAELNKYWEE